MKQFQELKTSKVSMVAICVCFAVWGFCNLLSNVFFTALDVVFSRPEGNTEPFFAFYVGYCLAAVPAVVLCRTRGLKMGIFFGLFACMAASYLFLPAAATASYGFFLVVYLLMSASMSLMEAAASPCVMAIGDRRTALYRINYAQSFNPLGAILGSFVGVACVSNRLIRMVPEDIFASRTEAIAMAHEQNLKYVTEPYLFLGVALLFVSFVVFFSPIDAMVQPKSERTPVGQLIKRLLSNKVYVFGVVALAFCIGVQMLCWRNSVDFARDEMIESGMSYDVSSRVRGLVSVVGMTMSCIGRFVCSAMLKRGYNIYKMMFVSSGFALACLLGVVFVHGIVSIACIILASLGLGMLFPSIYGLSLITLDIEESKIAAGGLTLSVMGAVVISYLYTLVSGIRPDVAFNGAHAGFLIGVVCLGVIIYYINWIRKRVEV